MNYIIREMGESEYAVLDDFLYEAIYYRRNEEMLAALSD